MLETLGLFLMLAGFVIGLGAVTVIDIHGFLGRKSAYWTETTIRAHKVTKPLIWLGILFAIIGGSILYRNEAFVGIPRIQTFIALALILNGCFLSFSISPKLLARERDGKARELLPASMQASIAASFVVSFTGWWSALFLTVRFLTN